MNHFDVSQLLIVLQVLNGWHAQLDLANKVTTKAAAIHRQLPEYQYQKILQALKDAYDLCRTIGFSDAARKVRISLGYVSCADPQMDVSALTTELRNIQEAVFVECTKYKFLWVAKDRIQYIDAVDPFGEEVSVAFPSSMLDIREAGNCFGAECNTACVFHLMRGAEFTLRAIARDRELEFADKPLEEKEWGQILTKLESEVGRLRQTDRKAWRRDGVRDVQIRFYAEIAQELRAFNDVWRRHVSHADASSFYDHDQATNTMTHVRALMQKAATKISEAAVTEEFWTAP